MFYRNSNYYQNPYQAQPNPYGQQYYYPQQQYPYYPGPQQPYGGYPMQQPNQQNFIQQQPQPDQYNQQQPSQQPGPSLSSMFTGENGKFDFNKASSTIDQVVKTANQVSPIVKQLGALFTPKK